MSKGVSLREASLLLKKSYSKWSAHHAARLGASVAFYSILSFAPLLVLMTAIVALFFGHENAHGALVNEARQVIGEHGARTVHSVLQHAQRPASGTFASLIAFITLLFGASGVFAELRDALNIMWDAPKQESLKFLSTIRQRLFSFGMVLSVGFLLLVLLILSSGLAYLEHSFGRWLPVPPFVLEMSNFIVSFAVVTVLFALMFKYVPVVHVAWREVILGAVGTAVLFTGGKLLLGIYLGKASVSSTYGAAGSLVAVVIWIYYSAQIFFFGAEFTRVHADRQRAAVAHDRPKVSGPEEQTASMTQIVKSAEMPPGSVAAPATPSAELSSPSRILEPVRVIEHFRPGAMTPGMYTKPRLLTAMAIGFLLGRLWASKRREGSAYFTGTVNRVR